MPSKVAELGRSPAFRPGRLAPWLDLAAGQAAWWWCILGARSGSPRLALLGPAAYLLGNALGRPRQRRAVLGLTVAGTLVGLAGDGLLARFELLSFPPALTLGWVTPFMLALWAMFAVSLLGSAAFAVRQSPWRVALLGAIAGPLAYAGGERLLVLSLSRWAPLAVAVEWALAVPLLALCARLGAPEQREVA